MEEYPGEDELGHTLIAAMDGGDCLLLGADSQLTESDGSKLTLRKLEYLEELPVAWGFSGDEGVGQDFTLWMRRYAWQDKGWQQLKADASSELSRLNGEKRRRVQESGVKEAPEDTAQVLIAGYIGGRPDILHLDNRGGATLVIRHRFQSIGSGGRNARLAFHAVRIALGEEFREDVARFRGILEAAVSTSPGCDFPLAILRVTENGVERQLQG